MLISQVTSFKITQTWHEIISIDRCIYIFERFYFYLFFWISFNILSIQYTPYASKVKEAIDAGLATRIFDCKGAPANSFFSFLSFFFFFQIFHFKIIGDCVYISANDFYIFVLSVYFSQYMNSVVNKCFWQHWGKYIDGILCAQLIPG